MTTATTRLVPRPAAQRGGPLTPTERRGALLAGAGLLTMTPVAVAAAALLDRPMSDGARSVLGAAFLVVAVLEVVAAWGLHHLLRDRVRPASVATLVSRSGYAVLLAVSALALALPGGDGAPGFRAGWSLALVVLGVHLVIAALALWRSRVVPRLVAVATGLAGTAYLVGDALGGSGGAILLAGQLVLMGWLLASGTERQRVNSRWVTPEAPGTTSTAKRSSSPSWPSQSR